MQNNDYPTDVKQLWPSDREAFEVLNNWAARMMKAGEKLDSQYLVEHFETYPGVVREYLSQNLKDACAKAEVDIKLLERLPTIEAERDSAPQSVKEMEAEADRLKARMAELATANEEVEVWFDKAFASGFLKAVDLTAVLALEVDFSFFTGKYDAREGKIWLEDQVAYDPAEHLEEEEEGSPEAVGEEQDGNVEGRDA